ncbi:HotDog domain-containing protein [Phaeosphaeria sp. MPI-PUGE-AT-0046c]|nr:HotDog domain-containing protein [Phaeosphaeria sp. MPI-PUGE-AT-0046c]
MAPKDQNPNPQNTGEALQHVQAQFQKFWESPKAETEAEARVQHVLDYFIKPSDAPDRFEIKGLREVKLVSANPETASACFELTVAPHLCSKFGTLHGAAAAMLLDMLTSTCLSMIARPEYLDAGHVSRALILSYHRPIQQGEKIRVKCRVVSIGKRMANLTGEIVTPDGKICVSCVHDKVILERVKVKL